MCLRQLSSALELLIHKVIYWAVLYSKQVWPIVFFNNCFRLFHFFLKRSLALDCSNKRERQRSLVARNNANHFQLSQSCRRAQNKPLKLVTAPSERWVRVQFSLNTGRPSSIPSGGDKIFKRGGRKTQPNFSFSSQISHHPKEGIFLDTISKTWNNFHVQFTLYTSILLVQPLW